MAMLSKDKRIDDYIAGSRDFARPVLIYLRKVVHKACPETKETIKWGFPHFEYGGKILCSMASFKEHCSFGLRLGSVMTDPEGILTPVGSDSGMGHLGKISGLKDLPSEKILIQYLHEAMELTDKGASKPKKKAAAKVLDVPDYFLKVLKHDKPAYDFFLNFSYSQRKDYVDWITEAKTEETRNRRMATALEWLREGKGRNWKYERKGKDK